MHYRRIFSTKKHIFRDFIEEAKYYIKNILCCFDMYKGCIQLNNFRLINYSFQNDYNSIKSEVVFLKKEIESILFDNDIDVVLPRKIKFRFMTMKENFILNHNYDDWNIFKNITIKKYPLLKQSLEVAENLKSFYAFNMFIMKKKLYIEFMEMMFNILFEMEKTVNLENKNDYQKRLFGFVSERFLNIFIIYKMSILKIKELDVIFIAE